MVFPIPLQRRHLLRYIATLFVLLPIFLFLFYISTSDSQGPLPWEPGFSPPEGPGRYEVEVPAYLEEKTFHIFDDAVKQGKVLFEETEPEIVVDDVGFEFEFRIAPFLNKKQILPPDSPGRKAPSSTDPFLYPPHEDIITFLGWDHLLMINKYAIYRPWLVIPTREYQKQSDDLTLQDVRATWEPLKQFQTKMVGIYNRGVESGSSQGHKHMQLFPQPAHALWPSRADSITDISTQLPHVPFQHFVLRLQSSATAEDVYDAYLRLLPLAKQSLAAVNSASEDYNVAMTSEWIALIPRRKAGADGPWGGNAAGMLGLISVPDAAMRDEWERLGWSRWLTELGVAFTE